MARLTEDATSGEPSTSARSVPARRHRPGSGERTRAGQRARLAIAMIDAVADNGYTATSVAEVITRAGVSRKTFYEHFADKQACLLFTYDLIAEEGQRRVETAVGASDGWPEGVEASIRALVEAAIASPGALRLSLIEIAAAGPEGIARRERAIARYQLLVRDALELGPGEGGSPSWRSGGSSAVPAGCSTGA